MQAGVRPRAIALEEALAMIQRQGRFAFRLARPDHLAAQAFALDAVDQLVDAACLGQAPPGGGGLVREGLKKLN